jgi:hypothetical protein
MIKYRPSIKVDLEEIACEVNWIHLPQDSDQWRLLWNAYEFLELYERQRFLIIEATLSFHEGFYHISDNIRMNFYENIR